MPKSFPDTGAERPPSIEIFKIAMLNKSFLKIIKFLFQPLKLKDFNNHCALNKLMDMLYLPVDLIENYHNSTADIFRFKQNQQIIENIQDSCVNGTFGGPVFDPLIVDGYISNQREPGMEELEDGGFAVTRRNGLKKYLYEQRNQVVGFYNLTNV